MEFLKRDLATEKSRGLFENTPNFQYKKKIEELEAV